MSDEMEFDESHALDMALNHMIKELHKVRVRYPNESNYDYINDFRLKYFESIEEYEYEIYGKYKGQILMVNKEDFNNIIL